MRTRTYILFIVFAFLSLPTVQAQSNFKRGYVITIQGDTISGLVNYRTDKLNAQRCVFKTNVDTEEKVYLPGEIIGYRFLDDGKYYVSRKIALDHGIEYTLFLEYLLQGGKNLYYYESDYNERLYFIEDGGRFIKLDAPELGKDENGLMYKSEVRRYIPTLQSLFRDYPSLQAKVKKIPFTHKALIGIVKEYNDLTCDEQGQCIIFETKEDKKLLSVDITPYMGAVYYSLASDMEEYYGDVKLSYLFGVNVSVYCVRWIRALSLTADLSISRQDMENKIVKSRYSSMLLTAKLGARFTFSGKRLKPFIGVGAEVSSFISSKYEKGIYYYDYRGLGDTYPGGYVETGLQYRLAKNWKRYLILRGQFEGTRNMLEKSTVFCGWSGSLGFAF